MSILPKEDSVLIREVWNDNLEEEFALIREIVDQYPFVAMDTEFPGIVLRPVGNFKSNTDFHYQTLKDNVDMLKLIQLGLTFTDEEGNLPMCGEDKFCIWQFNFREFNPSEDVFANDSIELLRQSGIDFKKNNEKGIDAKQFGELLMSSGIVLNDNVYWVTFHSGYDFGYLLKVLTCHNLPETQSAFFDLINIYFPVIYDIKHLMRFCNSLHGGLNKLAELLDVERVGICHQAGSDSLLTAGMENPEFGSSHFASTMKTTNPLDSDSDETITPPNVPQAYTSISLSDFPKIRRNNRQEDAKWFRREYPYGGSMDRKTCVWSCDGDSWLDKSSGIMWVGVHGINAICVVNRTGDLDIKRVRGYLKQHTIESFLHHFRQTVITEIEDLGDPDFPDQANKLRRVDKWIKKPILDIQPNKLRRVDKSIKKPFGVVSVVTDEVDKEISHEASYEVDPKHNKLADILLEKCGYMLALAQESIQKEYNLPAPAPLDEKNTIKCLLEKMETDSTFMINGTVKALEHDEKNAIKFFQEKMESDLAFTMDETIQAAICGFQHLLGKELKANEIGVTVLNYNVTGPEARYNNGYAKKLEIHDIEVHLAVVNKPGNGGFSGGSDNENIRQPPESRMISEIDD